jgi:hypothetical protein
MSGCTSRKRSFETYAEALGALADLAARGVLRGPFGSVYSCSTCELFHVSSRRFTLSMAKGRGKSRRKLVIEEGA